MSSEGLELITCSADKLVIFHKMTQQEPMLFARTNQIKAQCGMNSLALSGDCLVAACQDRQLRTFSMQGKIIRQVRGSISDDGQLTKIRIDPSGTFAAAVSSDRNVYIVEAATGECAAVLSGHSEMVTDVGFSPDCRRLVVVSSSGCVFVWRLSNLLSSKMSAKLKKTNAQSNCRLSPEKTNERSETPDSLIGSGSDGASEEMHAPSRLAKVKDSESEFGSLNSLRIADEDDDSCIGQKAAKIVVNQGDTEDFELKRVTTEVVRRSNSGVLSQHNSTWDIASTANDFSDEEGASGGANRLLPPSEPANRAGTSNSYTTSRSMSNLRPAMAYTTSGSPRRPRKKWDMSGDVAGYASPMAMHQSASGPQGFVTYNPSGPPPAPQPNANVQHLGGFMTMNGSHIYHAPTADTRHLENTYMNSSISTPGINQLGDSHPRSAYPSGGSLLPNDQPNVHLSSSAGHASRQTGGNGFAQSLLHSAEGPFDRQTNSRCSLTKRFLNTPSADDQPRTVWTPPAMSARRSTSNMHYSTPSGGTASSIVRRQSEMHSSPGGRLYQQNGANGGVTGDDAKSIRRARTMHRLKHRRMTIGIVEQSPSGNVLNSPKEEDYVTSDLHLRSRSQSPSQLALNAIVDGTNSRRQRQDSDMSLYSTVTMTSSRLTPASSRTNLRTIGVTNQQSSQTLNKLNEMRDKLRKSQENLAGAIGDELSGVPSSSSSLMSRSRSIGNLRFTAAAPLSSQRNDLNAPSVASHSEASSAYMPSAPSEGERKNSMHSNPLSTRNRFMARSVGSLHSNVDGAENGDEVSAPARLPGLKAPRPLAQTIESLKKASNLDLTQQALYNGASPSEGHDGNSFFTSTPIGKQRGKGAVQKRVERYQPRSRISRDTTSGESDSNASDANVSPLLHGSTVLGGQQAIPKRYFNVINGSNRSASSVEGLPRAGLLQSTRRIFEQQRTSSPSSTPRRAPNYLAQKLAGTDIVGPDMGAEECPRQVTSPSEASALHDFDGKSPQSKQMARHLAECIEQFNTGLDKVLQARQLLESSQHLPSDDKDTFLRVLNQTIRTGRRRLDVTDDRYEPDGGRSDSPNSITSQRQNLSQGGQQQLNPSSGQPELDTAALLQQHAPQIIAYLQQNMAKQN